MQNVGLRRRIVEMAGDFAVAGYVSNLSDGTVEVHLEGSLDETERFAHRIEKEFARNIRTCEDSSLPPRGFHRFEIAY